MNLRWSWHQETRDLFASVDPELWRACGGDPVRLLGEVSPARLPRWPRTSGSCAGSPTRPTTCADYLTAAALVPGADEVPRQRSRTSRRSSASPRSSRSTPAASASSPATTSRRPATSACRSSASACSTAPATSASRCPRDGWQQEHYPSLDPHGLPLDARSATPTARRCASRSPCPAAACCAPRSGRPRSAGCRCCCSTPTSRRTTPDRARRSPTGCTAATRTTGCARRCCSASAGCARCGRTARLTGHAGARGVPHQRGPRRLPRPGADPRAGRARGSSFDEALAAVRAGTVFTTHTPVPAGIDRFPRDLVRRYFDRPDVRPRRAGRRGCSRSAPRSDPGRVQHGAHGPAAGPARQRRRASCTARSAAEMFGGRCGPASTPTRCRSAR